MVMYAVIPIPPLQVVVSCFIISYVTQSLIYMNTDKTTDKNTDKN